MHESERNRLLKRQRMLGLAASDMSQATSAGRELSTVKPGDIHLRWALGTAVVVSYSRAFTTSTIVTLQPEEYEPPDEKLTRLHYRILALRDSECAHTDKDARRKISIQHGVDDSSAVVEEFDPVLSPEELGLALQLFEVQRLGFVDEALAIDKQLSAN